MADCEGLHLSNAMSPLLNAFLGMVQETTGD
jgi:hypothetical protein